MRSLKSPSKVGLWASFVLRVIIAVTLLVAAWPGWRQPLLTPDSAGYIAWPSDSITFDGFRQMGARPPVYPLFLKIVGTCLWLAPAQLTISILAWCTLGWAAGGVPGVFVLGLLATSTALAGWTVWALSESLNFSLVAVSVAATIHLARRWSLVRLVVWVVVGAGAVVVADVAAGATVVGCPARVIRAAVP